MPWFLPWKMLLTSILHLVPSFHLLFQRDLLIFLLYYHALHPQSITEGVKKC